jgi:hypothetical protein
MVISHKFRFIFLKTKKTAGTSLEVFLSDRCGPEDILTPIWPHVEPHRARNYRGTWSPLSEFADPACGIGGTLRDLATARRFYNHIPATTLRHRVPAEIWDSYFKFCVERNPWDKTLSHYHMVRNRTGGGLTLDEYLAAGDFCLNYARYTDEAGHQLVDEVVRYESLNEGLGRVFDRLGIEFDGSLGVRAKSEHRTDRKPYQERFTPEQRDIVTRAFRTEIEMHGYSF